MAYGVRYCLFRLQGLFRWGVMPLVGMKHLYQHLGAVVRISVQMLHPYTPNNTQSAIRDLRRQAIATAVYTAA